MSDHSTWSFRSGTWFGIFGEHVTVVLPPSEKARVAAIWELVDDGAGFDETLDALISTGLRELPGFVLVAAVADETRIVLRGPARAHFAIPGDVVHVEGDGATTWVERTLRDVTRVRIEVADESAPDDLVVSGGLVRVATAEWPAQPAGTPEPVAEPVAESVTESIPQVLPTSPPPPPPAAPPPPPPATPPPPPGPPPPPPVAAPDVLAPAEDEDHDGLTRTGSVDLAGLGRQHPGIPGQPPPPPVTARPVARLVFSSGQTVDVDRPVLVGRAPEARRFTSTDQPRLVTVPSPHQEISSTHVEVRPGAGADHGSAVVTDLGSTNGTLLLQPGLPAEDLKPGVTVQLIPGAVVDLGDGVSIQVVDA